jgi:hypothetical protein
MSYLVEFVYNTAYTYGHRVYLIMTSEEYEKYMTWRDITDHTGYPALVLTHDVQSDEGYHPMACRFVSANPIGNSCAESIREQVHNADLYQTFVQALTRLRS